MVAPTRTEMGRFLGLAEALRLGRDKMKAPNELPGRYGRTIKSIEKVLHATGIGAVVAGGWAVWWHGFKGRVTQDIDIALAADDLKEFLRVAAVSGFQVLDVGPGTWPKMIHRDTGIETDLLVEGAQPGRPTRPAPTKIPSAKLMGAIQGRLEYIALPSLFELKLASGRPKDEADVVELIRANRDSMPTVRKHLESIHFTYVASLDRLAEIADEPAP